jgi:hypothetical protein
MQSDNTTSNSISQNTPLKEVINSLDRTQDTIGLIKQLDYMKQTQQQYAARAELVRDRSELVDKGR